MGLKLRVIPRLKRCRVFPWLWNYRTAVWHMGSEGSWFGVIPSFAVIPEVWSFHLWIHWDGGVSVCVCMFNHWGRNSSDQILQTVFFFPTKKEAMDLVWRDVSSFFSRKKKILFMIQVGFIIARRNNWGSRERRNAVSWRIWIFWNLILLQVGRKTKALKFLWKKSKTWCQESLLKLWHSPSEDDWQEMGWLSTTSLLSWNIRLKH